MSKTGLSVQCVLFVSFFSYAHLIEVIMISSDEDDEAEQLEEREVTSTSGMFTKKKCRACYDSIKQSTIQSQLATSCFHNLLSVRAFK